MKTKILLTALLLLLAAAAGAWLLRNSEPPRAPAAGLHLPDASPAGSPGEILGLTIGDPVDEARRRLDPLRVPIDYTPDAKEKIGRRIYWKLRETEFDWIMVWGNPEGRITRIRGYLRADKLKPFREIGDLATADTVTAEAAKWHLRRPGGPPYRLIAQGADQRAQTVYMFSLEMPKEQDGPPLREPDDKN